MTVLEKRGNSLTALLLVWSKRIELSTAEEKWADQEPVGVNDSRTRDQQPKAENSLQVVDSLFQRIYLRQAPDPPQVQIGKDSSGKIGLVRLSPFLPH